MEGLKLACLLDTVSSGYPKPQSLKLNYGTAGFRDTATVLDSTVFRCGLIAGLRTQQCGKAVGLMITASHNPEQDNGVKMVESNGEMLVPVWEQHATAAANAETTVDLSAVLNHIIEQEGIKVCDPAAVVLAGDTRESTLALMQAAREGVKLTGAEVIDIGICTTPMLHYEVVRQNDAQLEEYYKRLVKGFSLLTSGEAVSTSIFLDCANGVGSLPASALIPLLAPLGLQMSLLHFIDGGSGSTEHIQDPPNTVDQAESAPKRSRLNHLCGSDFVQVGQQWPDGLSANSVTNALCASLDGDADRIIFYYSNGATESRDSLKGDVAKDSAELLGENQEVSPVILDGDYIAALVATYLIRIVNSLPVQEAVSVGVVQTAYANGASTAYLQEQGISVALALTGVKHLHEAAKAFDVGVFYEANGHGSVLFSTCFSSLLDECPAEHEAVQSIRAVIEVVNPAVGDGISNLLLVSGILTKLHMSPEAWSALYAALPSRLSKLQVQDRLQLRTTCMDTRLEEPQELQRNIDAAVANTKAGRAFVRPSGTQDVVRVYAEAQTQEEADRLALLVLQAVHKHGGGIGECPQSV